MALDRTKPGIEPYYSYGVKIRQVNTDLWIWQVDGEPGNGVLDFGTTKTRRRAGRESARTVRQHARRRGNRPDYWWVEETSTSVGENLDENRSNT